MVTFFRGNTMNFLEALISVISAFVFFFLSTLFSAFYYAFSKNSYDFWSNFFKKHFSKKKK